MLSCGTKAPPSGEAGWLTRMVISRKPASYRGNWTPLGYQGHPSAGDGFYNYRFNLKEINPYTEICVIIDIG
jgi:hypothetical protein